MTEGSSTKAPWPPIGQDPDGALLKILEPSPFFLLSNGRRLIVAIEVEELETDQISQRHAILFTQRSVLPLQTTDHAYEAQSVIGKMIVDAYWYCEDMVKKLEETARKKLDESS